MPPGVHHVGWRGCPILQKPVLTCMQISRLLEVCHTTLNLAQAPHRPLQQPVWHATKTAGLLRFGRVAHVTACSDVQRALARSHARKVVNHLA